MVIFKIEKNKNHTVMSNYHNGYSEGDNNFIKVIKRISFDFLDHLLDLKLEYLFVKV